MGQNSKMDRTPNRTYRSAAYIPTSPDGRPSPDPKVCPKIAGAWAHASIASGPHAPSLGQAETPIAQYASWSTTSQSINGTTSATRKRTIRLVHFDAKSETPVVAVVRALSAIERKKGSSTPTIGVKYEMILAMFCNVLRLAPCGPHPRAEINFRPNIILLS